MASNSSRNSHEVEDTNPSSAVGSSALNGRCFHPLPCTQDESVVGNEHIGTGENDNHNLNQQSVGDADSKYYFRLSACTKNDLPTANYTRTRDVEAQTIETGVRPTFILYHFSNAGELFWSLIGSLIIWWIQSILWYLQRVVG